MTGDLPHAVAAEIRAEMARQKLTQEALGQKVGLRQDQISRRLKCEVPITVAELGRIADALGVPATHFLASRSRPSAAA